MAVTETQVVEQVNTTTVDHEDKPYMVFYQIMNFIWFLIEGFLLLSFVLKVTGANPGAGFVRLVDGVADFLMIPFRFIFPVAQSGNYVFDWSILVAMLVYAIIFYAIRKAMNVAYTADKA